MKDTIAKYLPFVVGGIIGWLMFNPPSWLALAGQRAGAGQVRELRTGRRG